MTDTTAKPPITLADAADVARELTPENGYFLSRLYSSHPDCTCPHGLKYAGPHCEMHPAPSTKDTSDDNS